MTKEKPDASDQEKNQPLQPHEKIIHEALGEGRCFGLCSEEKREKRLSPLIGINIWSWLQDYEKPENYEREVSFEAFSMMEPGDASLKDDVDMGFAMSSSFWDFLRSRESEHSKVEAQRNLLIGRDRVDANKSYVKEGGYLLYVYLGEHREEGAPSFEYLDTALKKLQDKKGTLFYLKKSEEYAGMYILGIRGDGVKLLSDIHEKTTRNRKKAAVVKVSDFGSLTPFLITSTSTPDPNAKYLSELMTHYQSSDSEFKESLYDLLREFKIRLRLFQQDDSNQRRWFELDTALRDIDQYLDRSWDTLAEKKISETEDVKAWIIRFREKIHSIRHDYKTENVEAVAQKAQGESPEQAVGKM